MAWQLIGHTAGSKNMFHQSEWDTEKSAFRRACSHKCFYYCVGRRGGTGFFLS